MGEQPAETENGGEDDMRSKLIVMYQDQAEDNISTLSLGDQSYIMDLANQKQYRTEIREEEAMEDALELFKTAIEEGAQKTVDLFKRILAQVLKELNEENEEKDRLQDEWLEAALQEEIGRQNNHSLHHRGGNNNNNGSLNVSNHTLSKSQHSRGDMTASIAGPPSIYNDATSNSMLRRHSTIKMLDLDQKIHDEEKKILQKKMKKAERLLQEVVDEKGETEAKTTLKYKRLKKKLKEYRATLKTAERDDLRVSMHSKSVMYDWGATAAAAAATNNERDTIGSEKHEFGSSSSSSSSNESSSQSNPALTPEYDEDLEWAKQVVARLTLDADDGGPPKEVSIDQSPAASPKRSLPHKNISFNTAMATTRRLSSHDLMIKSRLSAVKPPLVKHHRHHLAATKEEDDEELEESATTTALVSDGSTHTESTPKGTGSKSNNPPPPSMPQYSPGKRKSPSWKKVDAVNITPAKQVVSQDHLQGTMSNLSPPLSDNRQQSSSPSARRATASTVDAGNNKLYTLEAFQQGKVSGVDMDHWEQFLLTEEFEKHFKMSRLEFEKLPKWKKLSAKRRLRTWG